MGNEKIPKIIHQIWIGPRKAPKYMNTWKDNHPDYEYVLWDNQKIKKLFPLKNQHLYDQYDNEKKHVWNGRSNLLRYEILDKYGGIYIDADSVSLKPLDDQFLENSFFIVYANEKARPGILANGVLGSIARHPILNEVINILQSKNKIEQPSHLFSGPTFITNIINSKKYDITKYPSYYFYPEFYSGDGIYDYKGDFEPYSSHKWGSTKRNYSKATIVDRIKYKIRSYL